MFLRVADLPLQVSSIDGFWKIFLLLRPNYQAQALLKGMLQMHLFFLQFLFMATAWQMQCLDSYWLNHASVQELTEEEMAAATGKAKAILDEFKPFFTRPDIRKVWHNYSFDRHVLANMDIHCQGFAGDTMHMARLLDSSRKGTRNYSLANLTG